MNHLAGAPGLTETSTAVLENAGRMRLVALVVTYNRPAQLRLTIDRLLAEDVDAILVVDNASTDGSTQFLSQITDSRLHILTLTENCGGAGGFEQGLREVSHLFDPDWCVLMDDDARPEPGAMTRFLSGANAVERDGYDALAAGVFYPDGRICEMNRPSRNPFWHMRSFLRTIIGGGRGGFHVSDEDYATTTPVQIDATSFVGFFLSRKGLNRAGFPDGRLFIYGDDVLYTLKLSRAGGLIGFAPWLRFEHDCSTFRHGERRIHRPVWKVYYNYRNGLLAYREAAGPIFFWPVLAVVAVKWRLHARHAGEDRRAYLTLLHLAIRDAVRNRIGRTPAEIRRIANELD
ncbi:MAG: glycosyltransferase [Cypionkella sp.]